MTRLSPALDRYLSEFARVERTLPGHGDRWLDNVRKEGLDRLLDVGFPGTRDEDWKYTDAARPIEKRGFDCATEVADVDADQLRRWLMPELGAHLLVFVNGRFAPALSRIGDLPAGVTLQPLSDALATPGDVLHDHLGTRINGNADGFTALNTAFMSDGVFLHIAPGRALEAPVHALFVGTGAEHPLMANLRNLVVLEDGAEAMLIEHYAGPDDALYFANAMTEVSAGANSHLHRFRVQAESVKSYHVEGLYAHQGRDSHLTNHGLDFGGRLARTGTNSVLDAPGAEAILYGVYAPRGRQHVDNHTRVDHAKPHGRSRGFYRGVLDQHARGVFNGKVVVHRDAQKTDSEQASDALLLSKTAEVDAKPELEIYADDVKCAHGNTVGQLDEAAVFYLRSRGLDGDGARSLLTYSFAEEIIRHIRLEALRKHVEATLLARLPNGDQIRELL